MDNSEKRQQYLEISRQQLQHEMDAMGYGQRSEHTPIFGRQASTKSTSNEATPIVAFTLMKYRLSD